MKEKMIEAHMQVAEIYAKLSSARRLQVGAIVVKDDRIISIGYNGMPAGWDNNCEDEVVTTESYMIDAGGPEHLMQLTRLKTKPEVLHAEMNCIYKIAKSRESALGSKLFVTHAPCFECAKAIFSVGMSGVFYRNSYRNEDGIRFLEKCNIEVRKI